MDRVIDLFDPLGQLMLDLGVRLDFLVPAVAIASMGAGILTARYTGRQR